MNFSSIDTESYDRNTFGKCIRQQREENNMKLTEVASKVGITKVYLSDIERGNRVAPVSNTNLDKLYKLMKVLNIPEDQAEFVIDMAYASRGCPKDIIDFLAKHAKARRILRRAISAGLSEEEWEELLDYLDKMTQRKSLTP